jgi:hypothetical protein
MRHPPRTAPSCAPISHAMLLISCTMRMRLLFPRASRLCADNISTYDGVPPHGCRANFTFRRRRHAATLLFLCLLCANDGGGGGGNALPTDAPRRFAVAECLVKCSGTLRRTADGARCDTPMRRGRRAHGGGTACALPHHTKLAVRCATLPACAAAALVSLAAPSLIKRSRAAAVLLLTARTLFNLITTSSCFSLALL